MGNRTIKLTMKDKRGGPAHYEPMREEPAPRRRWNRGFIVGMALFGMSAAGIALMGARGDERFRRDLEARHQVMSQNHDPDDMVMLLSRSLTPGPGDARDHESARRNLIMMGDRSVPALLRALGSQRENLRAHAAEILGELGRPGTRGPLSELAENDPSPHVRRAAERALMDISDR